MESEIMKREKEFRLESYVWKDKIKNLESLAEIQQIEMQDMEVELEDFRMSTKQS